jgi:hypothetical protein
MACSGCPKHQDSSARSALNSERQLGPALELLYYTIFAIRKMLSKQNWRILNALRAPELIQFITDMKFLRKRLPKIGKQKGRSAFKIVSTAVVSFFLPLLENQQFLPQTLFS